MIRLQYCERVFEYFVKNYVESLKLRSDKKDEKTWRVFD